jgi:hypothetical protein
VTRALLFAALLCAGCNESAPPPACEDAGPCALSDGGAGKCCGYGTDCVDLGDDAANCGACGLVCQPGQSCFSGSCG